MTKVEFLDWKEHPVTIQMYKAFMDVREELKEGLASGYYLENSIEAAKRVGMIEGLDFFLKAEWEGEDQNA